MIFTDPADYMARYHQNPSPLMERAATLVRGWLANLTVPSLDQTPTGPDNDKTEVLLWEPIL